MRHVETVTVAYSACGPGDLQRPDALVDLLQDTAGLHATALGLPLLRLLDAGLSWALARERIIAMRWPRSGERVEITTWPCRRQRQFLQREFELRDGDGSLLLAASSTWVILDLATRTALPDPGPWIAGIAFDGPEAAGFPGRTVPALRTATTSIRLRPRRADLDVNEHVNHARLTGYLLEPAAVAPEARPGDLDLLFRAECRPEDEVEALAERCGDGRWRHSLRRADGTELARAASRWPPDRP